MRTSFSGVSFLFRFCEGGKSGLLASHLRAKAKVLPCLYLGVMACELFYLYCDKHHINEFKFPSLLFHHYIYGLAFPMQSLDFSNSAKVLGNEMDCCMLMQNIKRKKESWHK